MTDEQLIQQIEQILADLKAGDESAISRLNAIVGDVVGGDKITTGNITHSTVVLGRHIEMTVNEGGLSPAIIEQLNGLLTELRGYMRRGFEDYSGDRRALSVFLSSPGDVADERLLAENVIKRLNMNQFMPFKIDVFLWERADIPLFAHRDPQANIDDRIMPADCDIVVIILWSKMGTPMGVDKIKPDRFQYPLPPGDDLEPSRYLSGTEYEFVNAMQAAEENGQPLVLVYRREEIPDIKLNDPERSEKTLQWDRVEAFFKSFKNEDDTIRWSRIAYAEPNEFGERFEGHLLDAIGALFYQPPRQASPSTTVKTKETEPWDPDRSPFPGLRPFQPDDAVVFFGRERETDRLIRRLKRERFVAIVAASGSGKSSLARAGLIPRLREGALPGVSHWHIVTMKPGADGDNPFQALAAALLRDLPSLAVKSGADFEARRDELTGGLTADAGAALQDLVTEILAGDEHLLVLIDQFEELFTVVDESHQAPFSQAICALAELTAVRVVITMRADFYHRCMELPALRDLLEEGTFPLYPPEPYQLYDMISRPAGVASLVFENGLDERIWQDTADEPGALALVAYTLQRLWEAAYEAGESTLRHRVYDAFGDPAAKLTGVKGAIGAEAEQAYQGLDEHAQSVLPSVFARLVAVERSQDGGFTAIRRVAPFEAVVGVPDSPDARLVDALVDRRLLVADRDPLTKKATLEVAHEAIFRSWRRLRDWIQETGEHLRLIDDLKRQARRWQESGYDENFLWRQEQMDPVLKALEAHPELCGELNHDEELYWRFLRPEYLRLWDELHESEIGHIRRAEIGDRLAQIADPRPGVGLVSEKLSPLTGESMLSICNRRWEPDAQVSSGREVRLWGDRSEHLGLPDIVWLPVSGGEQEVKGEIFSVQPFYIAKHILTNWQFKAFEEAADGWVNPRWWQGIDADEGHREAPDQANRPTGNHPRTDVSWWDAIAFCAWLSARLGHPTLHEWLEGGKSWETYPGIRLPTEWEWQWATSGEGQGRKWAFGEWDGLKLKANTTESGLSRTTAVGMYPEGTALCGALDLSGNAFEWCLNESGDAAKTGLRGGASRVVRGGSWSSNEYFARADFRDGWNPYDRLGSYGFRVVVRVPALP